MIGYKEEIRRVLSEQMDYISLEYKDKVEQRIQLGLFSWRETQLLQNAIIKARARKIVKEIIASQKGENMPEKKETPLDKANLTIRKANIRINELKSINLGLESELSQLKKELSELRTKHETNQKMCPYEVLGISSHSSKIEIKKRYKQLSNIFHPDKCGISSSGEMSKLINISYREISTRL